MYKWQILIRPSEKLEFHPSSLTRFFFFFFNEPPTITLHPLTLQLQLLCIFIFLLPQTN